MIQIKFIVGHFCVNLYRAVVVVHAFPWNFLGFCIHVYKMYTFIPVTIGTTAILQEVYFLQVYTKSILFVVFLCIEHVYYWYTTSRRGILFVYLRMFQIISTKSIHQVYTKCIHKVYLKSTQCSILHVCLVYTISIFHFVKGIDENDDSTISESPPCSQAPSVVVSEAQGMSTWPLAVNQAIVKGVFGRILNRDDIVYILKKKFLYSKRT